MEHTYHMPREELALQEFGAVSNSDGPPGGVPTAQRGQVDLFPKFWGSGGWEFV